MAYTTQQKGNLFELYETGDSGEQNRIATGTESYITDIAEGRAARPLSVEDIEKSKKIQPVSTISSGSGVAVVNKAMDDTNRKPETTPKTETSKTIPPTAEDKILQSQIDSTKTPEQLSNEKIRNDLITSFDSQEQSIKTSLDPIKAQMEESKRAQIDSIYSQFSILRNQLVESNRRRENASVTLGIRKGGQYAPTVMASQIEGVVQQGLQKVSELNSQERDAINKVNNAFNEQSLTLAMKEYESLQDIRKEKDKALAEFDKNLVTLNKKAVEDSTKLNNQTLIHDAAIGTDGSVSSIYEALKGKVSTDEIKNYIDDISVKEPESKKVDRFTSSDTMKLLGAGLDGASQKFVYDEIVKTGWLNFKAKYGSKLTPQEMKVLEEIYVPKDKELKAKADSSPKSLEYLDYELTAMNKIPIQVRNSVAESDYYKSIIKQNYDAGVPASKIGDTLSGFRIQNETPFAAGMRDMFKMLDKNWTQSDTANMAALINSNREDLAVQKFENHMMGMAQQRAGTDFISESSTRFAITKADQIRGLLDENGLFIPGGPVAGTLGNWIGRFNSSKQKELKAYFTNLTANLQKERAGTAMTDNEWKRIIEPSIPQITDTLTVVKKKLDELERNGLVVLNSERNSIGLPSLNKTHLAGNDVEKQLKSKARLYYQTPIALQSTGGSRKIIDTVDDTGKSVKVINTVDDLGNPSQATFQKKDSKWIQLLPDGKEIIVKDQQVLSQLEGNMRTTASGNKVKIIKK